MSSMVTRMRRMAMEKLLVWGNVSMGNTRSGRNGSPLYTWEGGRVRWTRDSMHSPAETRFGPNRVAAEMEGNGEFHFWVIFEDFWRHS